MADQNNHPEDLHDAETTPSSAPPPVPPLPPVPPVPAAPASAPTPSTEPAPERVGPYRIVREIGRGGMGVVYLGVRDDDQLRRVVAIKLIKRGVDTADVLARFERERQVLAALDHPNIARLLDAGRTPEGLPYFVLEHIEGQPIHEYCDGRRLDIAERLRLFGVVCGAVHYAHQNLIVHRDIKPRNILVTRDGKPKLLDFGIAKILNPGLSPVLDLPTAIDLRVMTPEYASPEQVRGDPVTTASDIYSLGVVLFELLTGHRPYRLKTRMLREVERVVCEEDPERPSTAISRVEVIEPGGSDEHSGTDGSGSQRITPESVSRARGGAPQRLRRRLAGDLDNIVLMALRKEPQRRYVSAEQLANDIRRHLGGETVMARRDTFTYRASKFVRRHRAAVAAAVAIVLLLAGGLTATTWQARVATRERDRAQRRFDEVRSLARVFLFDVHDAIERLEGSLEARDLLVRTGRDHLARLAADAGDDPALLLEIAAGHKQLGDIQGGMRGGSRGRVDDALASYRESLALSERVLADHPGDPDARRAVAVAKIAAGDAHHMKDERGASLALYREALEHRNVLDARTTATVILAIGDRLLQAGHADEAEAHFDESIRMRRVQLQGDPGDAQGLRDLFTALGRSARLLEDRRRAREALDRYREIREHRIELARLNPLDASLQRDCLIAHWNLGRLQLDMGEIEPARDELQRALAIAQQLGDAPSNPDVRPLRDLALVHDALGRTFLAERDWRRAAESLERACAAIDEVVRRGSITRPDRALHTGSHERLAGALAEIGDDPAAEAHYQTALSAAQDWIGTDAASPRRVHVARLRTLLGGVVARDPERFEEAIGLLESALELHATFPGDLSSDPDVRADRAAAAAEAARLLNLSGRAGRALEYATLAIELAGERRPDLLRELALALHMSGDTAKALRVAQEALDGLGPETLSSDELRRRLKSDVSVYGAGNAGNGS